MMVVNHAGTLTPNYFKSYIKLMMNVNESSLEESKDMAFEQLFGKSESRFGEETYKSFLLAYEELKNDISRKPDC